MNIEIIACSILKKEIEYLITEGFLPDKINYIDSIYHMYPQKIQNEIDNITKTSKSEQIIIIFGDCSPYMSDIEKQQNIIRLKSTNCCEMITGTELYKKYIKDGAFFLFPEWVEKWKDVFQNHLGLSDENAKYLMKEFHKKLVYINTNLVEIPYNILDEISDFTGLKYEILNIDLSAFKELLTKTINKAEIK